MKNLFPQSESGFELLTMNYFQIGLTVLFIVAFIILRSVLHNFIIKHAGKYRLDVSRATYIKKIISYGLLFVLIVLIGFVWDISFKGFAIYFASLFTIIGVAFFASWSVLSNITAALILYFYFPVEIGASVKIMDGDNSVSGKVIDMTIFSIKILLDSGEKLSYPNNLAIQKPIIELKG